MMTVEIQSDAGPFYGVKVAAVVKCFGSFNGQPFLTGECTTYLGFCSEIDLLIRQLEELKLKAKIKFDEFLLEPN